MWRMRGRRVSGVEVLGSLVAVLAATTGCSRVGSAPPAPAPAPDPGIEVETPVLRPDPEELPAPEPILTVEPADPILGSDAATHPPFRRRTEHWIGVWTGAQARWFPRYLARMAVYEELVDEALARYELPSSLRYLPVVESGYSPRAVSRASAVGLWQFMSPTARAFGLQVGPLVDERRDPVRSTMAAARYLAELRERFGSWFLALAAYNGGPSRVERLLRRHAPRAAPADSLYFVIQPHLPLETREFVPKFFAAVEVARNLERYGFELPGERSSLAYDEVTVPDATSLDVVAELVGVREEEVRRLNPQVLRFVTPRGVSTTLRVPEGTGWRFREGWDRIPPAERVTVAQHTVERGETLWDISRRYGIRLAELEAANPDVSPRRLRPGDRLIVPLVPGGGARSDRFAGAEGAREHVVQPGDTLWGLARRYGVALEDLKRWNGLEEGRLLRPGQTLRLGGS